MTGRAYGGKLPDERSAERRERLLEAGLELFGTIGFDRTTVRAVCAAAGVTGRHFYEAFDDVEALLFAVYDRVAEETAELFTVGPPESEDVRPFLRPVLDVSLHGLAADARRARILLLETGGGSLAFERHRARTITRFAALLVTASEGLRARGVLTSPVGRLRAIGLIGAAYQLQAHWLTHRRDVALDDVVDELVELFAAGMGA